MYQSKMMIVMRRDLKMRKGKIAAQAGHAAIEAILTALKKEERLQDLVMTEERMIPTNPRFANGSISVAPRSAFTSIPKKSFWQSQRKQKKKISLPPSSPMQV